MDIQVLENLAGTYRRPFGELHLGVLGGRLIGQYIYRAGFPDEKQISPPPPPPFTLELCENHCLRVLDGPIAGSRADIIYNEFGEAAYMRLGLRLHAKE